MKVRITCCMCDEETTHYTNRMLPNDWEHTTSVITDSNAWCPEHKRIKEFADSQCPGCIGEWKNCFLWDAITRDIGGSDLSAIRNGYCPRRLIKESANFGGPPVLCHFAEQQASEESGNAFAEHIIKIVRMENEDTFLFRRNS